MMNYIFGKKFSFVILFLFLIIFNVNVISASTLSKNVLKINNEDKINAGLNSFYFVDKNKDYDIEDVKKDILNDFKLNWIKSETKNMNFGFTNSRYWVCLKIDQSNFADARYFLELDYPHMDYVDLYILDENKIIDHVQTGDKRPFENRDIFYRNFAYELDNSNKNIYAVFKLQTTGSITVPLYIWKYNALHKKIVNETLLLGMYYGLLLIIVIINLLLYFTLKDINYIFYILWVVGYGMYQFAINGLGVQFLWPNSPFLSDVSIPFLILCGIAAAYGFGRSFLQTSINMPTIDKFFRFLPGVMIVAALTSLIVPYYIIIRFAMISAVLLAIVMFSVSLICLLRHNRAARFYMTAWSFVLVGVTIYAFKSAGFLPENNFTIWSQQIGSAFEMTILSFALADRINLINIEINEAYKKILVSEERYRTLVEGTDDIIFILNSDADIISINGSVNKLFKIPRGQIMGRSFYDLVYSEKEDEKGVIVNNIKSRIKKLLRDKESADFRTHFLSPIKSESQYLYVKLEYINLEGRDEILGRAYPDKDDNLMKFFISERQELAIDNMLLTVEDVGYRITRNLEKYFDKRKANIIRAALREILVNAIEHGNLNITFSEKTKALDENQYFELISKRREDGKFKDKKVFIKYKISPEKVVYLITDEGDGFDHRKVSDEAAEITSENMLAHGRGILMTKSIFDEVVYNKKGNAVKLVKYVQKNVV